MSIKRETILVVALWGLLALTITGLGCYHGGRASMRAEITETIKSQQVAPAKVIKIPQLGLSIIPFERGILSWHNGAPQARLAKGGK